MADGTDVLEDSSLERDAWTERVLQVLPPARNRGPVRTELQTRAGILGNRLANAVDAATDDAKAELTKRRDGVEKGVTASLTASALLSDTNKPSNFIAAVKQADAALGRMRELAELAERVGQAAESRRDDRMRLNTAYVRQQETMRAQSGRALGGGGPGPDELTARDAENEMRAAIESAAFTSNLASDGEFGQAKQAAETALQKWTGASGGLKDRGDTGEVQEALRAIAGEREALKPATGHVAFKAPALALDKTLDEAAKAVEGATGGKVKAAETGRAAAADGRERRLKIEAAIGVFDPLYPRYTDALKEADATAKATLQSAFKEKGKSALQALEKGEDGTEPLRAFGIALEESIKLTATAKGLRERGGKLSVAFEEAKSGLSADQLTTIGDVTALTEKLKDVTPENVATLPGELERAETALTQAKETREAYRLADAELRQTAAGFGVSKALPMDGKALFVAAIDAAEVKRRTAHADGLAALELLKKNAAAFGAFCTTAAGFDAPLATAGVRDRVKDDLSALDAKAALAAPDTIPALRDAAAKLANPLLAWAAFHAVKLDAAPLKNVPAAEGAYRQKLQAAEGEARAGNVQAAGQAAAALKDWLAGVAQFAKGEKPRDDALGVKGDPTITKMLADAVGAYDTAKNEGDFGLAGQLLGKLAALVKPATDLEAARKTAEEALKGVVGTGSEAKKQDNANKDAELAKKITDALTGLAADVALLGQRRQTLSALLNEINQVRINRQAAVKTEIGGNPLTTQKAGAIFADDESTKLAMQLHAWLGKGPMQAMLATIGDGSGGLAALTKAVKQLGGLGKDTLAMLKDQLANAGHIGKLCEPDGSVTFLKDLATKFTGEEAKLGGLMQTGAGGDINRFKAMADGKADRTKAIADTFQPAKLKTLLDGCNDPATIKSVFGLAEPDGKVDFIKKLADKFGGEEAKLGGLMRSGVGNDTERFKAMVDGKEDRAKEISDKFNADLPQLRSLLQTGFGDDNATIKGVFDNGGVDQVKDLSDKFPNRPELRRMTTAMGGGDAGLKIKTIAGDSFGGDWKKMKDPFYENLKNAPDGNRLMRDADQFTGKGPPIPPVANKGHFDSVGTMHVGKRHTPENFNFNDIKASNTQFTKAARQTLPATIQAAVTAVNPWYPPPPNPVSDAYVAHQQRGYAKFNIMGLRVGVSYRYTGGVWKYDLPQIFPLAGDQYSSAQMNKLKLALAR